MIDLHRILYLVTVFTLTFANISGPMGPCLANCASCDPHALTICKGLQPCQWGYHDRYSNGTCQIVSSLQINQQELGQAKNQGIVPLLSGWGQDVKLTKCSYFSKGAKQQIDVIGFFSGAQSIEKQYTVTQQSQLLYISFTLVRDEWVPFSDFLMIELSSQGKQLDLYEISYGSMVTLESQETQITCDGRKVLLQQYQIKFNKKIKSDKIKISFSSFLFQGIWGITNLKIMTGCQGFASIDTQTLGCKLCKEGNYLESYSPDFGVCKSCPPLCKTCQNANTCDTCHWGSLVNGKCQASSTYKSQNIALQSIKSCGNYPMSLSAGNTLTLPTIRNEQNHLYDEVIASLTIYYDNNLPKAPNQLSLTINGQSIHNVTLENDQKYEQTCSLFDSGKMNRIQIVTKAMHVNDNAIKLGIQLIGVNKIGVSQVEVYSVKKDLLNQQPTVTTDGQILNSQAQQDQILTNQVQPQTSNNQVEAGLPLPKNKVEPSQQSTKVGSTTGVTTTANRLPTPTQIKFDSNNDPYSNDTTYAVTSKGLFQLSIQNVPIIQGQLMVQIYPLNPNQYYLKDTFYSQKCLIVLINITQSFVNGKITVREVATQRLLVVGQSQIVTMVEVERYDVYSQQTLESIDGFGAFFNIISWMAIISMLLAILSGFGIIVEQHIITVQLLYLHVYVGYDLLPLSFRQVVANLRTVGFLHFVPEVIVENQWELTPEAMYWLAPGQFNFIHAFMPIFISILVYVAWFFGLVALKKWFLPHQIPDESRSTLHKMADNIVCRVINFIDSIWRYQFISVLLICLMQFVASTRQDQVSDLFFAVVTIIATVVWFVISEFYIRNQYYENEYSQFIYKFEDRYFCKIPLHSLPSRHHRLGYPLVRVTKLLVFVVLALLVQIPLLVLGIMMAINLFELWYIVKFNIYSDRKMFKLKIAESFMILALESLLFGVRIIANRTQHDLYVSWGYFLATIVLMTILLTMSRMVFILYLKYVQSKGISFEEVDIDQKKLQTDRAV